MHYFWRIRHAPSHPLTFSENPSNIASQFRVLFLNLNLSFCSQRSIKSMEHGSFEDPSKATFSFTDEDHTLANAVRFTLNQDPRVTFCGYSIPHPSDARVNIRVQTTGDPAREVLNDSCQDLMLICQHVRGTFDQAISKFKTEKGLSPMDLKK